MIELIFKDHNFQHCSLYSRGKKKREWRQQPSDFIEILWKFICVNDFIPLRHRNMAYAETIPNWVLLKLKAVQLT